MQLVAKDNEEEEERESTESPGAPPACRISNILMGDEAQLEVRTDQSHVQKHKEMVK